MYASYSSATVKNDPYPDGKFFGSPYLTGDSTRCVLFFIIIRTPRLWSSPVFLGGSEIPNLLFVLGEGGRNSEFSPVVFLGGVEMGNLLLFSCGGSEILNPLLRFWGIFLCVCVCVCKSRFFGGRGEGVGVKIRTPRLRFLFWGGGRGKSRNSEPSPVFTEESEILNPLLCSLGNQNFWNFCVLGGGSEVFSYLSFTMWGTCRDKKFRR